MSKKGWPRNQSTGPQGGLSTGPASGTHDMKAPEPFYVTVDGQSIAGMVAQTGKSTWRAWAEFQDKQIEATGRSKQNAVDGWQAAANFEANK